VKCPNCGDVEKLRPIACRRCHTVFDSVDFEKFNHLAFLRKHLETWHAVGALPSAVAARLFALTDREIQDCIERRGGALPARLVRAPEQAAPPLQPRVPAAQAVPAAPSGESTPTMRATAQAGKLVLPRPTAPPRPTRPQFSWKQVGIYLLSERTLNGLLGIGAFLILAAAFVISTVNPTGLSPWPHLAMMVATTAVFYVSGILVQRKLDLPRTGAALLSIGAVFIPLDTLTLGRDILLFDWATNWLAVSILCLPLYLISHLMLRGRPFALLTTISGGSLLFAAGNQLGVPSSLGCAALSVTAIGYLLLGHRLRHEWPALTWALFWTAQLTTPLVMGTLLAARLLPADVLNVMPAAWHTALSAQRGAALDYAAGTAWWLGTIFYLLAARISGQRVFHDIAAWVLPFAFLFTLSKAPWAGSWDGFCLVPLAVGYLLYGRFAAHLLQQKAGSYRYRDVGRAAVFQVALALSVIAAAWPLAQFTSEIATLVALAGTFAAAAFLLRQRTWAYVATYLVLVVQVRQLHVPQSAVTAARNLRLDQLPAGFSFALVGGLMLVTAEYLVRRSGESRRPFLETALGLGAWRSLFAGALFSAGYLGTVLAVGLTFSDGTPIGQLSAGGAGGLLAVVGIYALSAAGRRTGILLYPAAGLLLMSFSSLAAHIARHAGIPFSDPALARCLAVLGVGYLVLAARLDRADGRYARPLYLAGYLLGLGTITASIPDRAINVQLIGLTLLSYGWSAWRVHRDQFPSFTWLIELSPDQRERGLLHMLFQYLAIWSFPAWLLLMQSLWRSDATPAAYGLVLAATAPLYLVLGLVYRRVRAEYRLPWFVGGYALSVLGPALATTDRSLSMVALALSIAVYAASAVQSRRAEWLWLPAALLPVLLYQVLYRFSDPVRFLGLAVVVLSLGYGLLGLTLQRGDVRNLLRQSEEAFGRFAVPFLITGQFLCAAGLMWALGSQDLFVAFLAWLLGAVHYAACYARRRGIFSWPLACTVAAAYVMGQVLTPLGFSHFSVGLLPLVTTYLLGTELLRRRQFTAAVRAERLNFRRRIALWSTPFSLLGHIGAFIVCVSAGIGIGFEWGSGSAEAVAILWLTAALYGGCTIVSRCAWWFYVALVYALTAFESTIVLPVPDSMVGAIIVANIVPAWVLLILSHLVSRAQPHSALPGRAVHPWNVEWARPLLLWGAVVLIVSTLASITRPLDGLSMLTVAAYFPLLAVLGSLWRDRVLVWGSLLLAATFCQEGLIVSGVRTVDQPLYWTGAALLAGGLGAALQSSGKPTTEFWIRPLYATAALIWGTALWTATAGISDNRQALQTSALILAMSGAACLLAAARLRRAICLAGGLAMLTSSYVIEMVFLNVTQPQMFTVPVGIAMYVLAYLEWRQSTSSDRKDLLEVGAVIGLLGTALLQALGQLDATGNHLAYDAFLLLEGTTILGFGAALRWTKTFFAGGAAIVAGMLIVAAEPLRNLSVVYLALLIGCTMIAVVVFLEQRRRRIPLWIDEVRLSLETWH
jgi:hypothetical protein